MIENCEFDMIYHERLFYHTLHGLTPLFSRHGLYLNDVERLPIHGGSLRLTVSRSPTRSEALDALFAHEAVPGVDDTVSFYNDFADRVRALRDSLAGLLDNRAIDVVKGDYILWINDDVLVDVGWLTAYVETFRRWPEGVVFGGRIRPRYDSPVEKWIIESESLLAWPYGIRDFGDDVLSLSVNDQGHFPYGANWAIRAAEQRA